jgi:hypothetical protein
VRGCGAPSCKVPGERVGERVGERIGERAVWLRGGVRSREAGAPERGRQSTGARARGPGRRGAGRGAMVEAGMHESGCGPACRFHVKREGASGIRSRRHIGYEPVGLPREGPVAQCSVRQADCCRRRLRPRAL